MDMNVPGLRARLAYVVMGVMLVSVAGSLGMGMGMGGERVAESRMERLSAVATTGMVADAVAMVGGDRVGVEVLIKPGLDPHLFKPSRSDVRRVLRAEAVFFNGLHLEGKLTDSLERASASGTPVFAVAEEIDPALLIPATEEGEEFDPHVWMDPPAWSLVVESVRDRLAQLRPDERETFVANAKSYQESLRALHEYSARVLGTVPEEQRVLVTAHDAFGYFGRRYGFEVVGIQGISTESEAGLIRIERLVDLLVTRRIGAVFVESTVSDRNIKALIDGARARGHAVRIGGTLFSDALGPEGTYEGTYVGMIDHNVTTIARGLGGEAPARGMNGKLAP